MTTDQDAAREPQVTTFPHHLGSISPRDLQTLELVEEVVLALPSGGGGELASSRSGREDVRATPLSSQLLELGWKYQASQPQSFHPLNTHLTTL